MTVFIAEHKGYKSEQPTPKTILFEITCYSNNRNVKKIN